MFSTLTTQILEINKENSCSAKNHFEKVSVDIMRKSISPESMKRKPPTKSICSRSLEELLSKVMFKCVQPMVFLLPVCNVWSTAVAGDNTILLVLPMIDSLSVVVLTGEARESARNPPSAESVRSCIYSWVQ